MWTGQSGPSQGGIFFATLVILGAFVITLGVGWQPLRRRLLALISPPSPANCRRFRKRSMTDFSPREIVSELDRFIIGQGDAKRAVAIALRNRWRRLQLDDKLREEVLPKNILMIGPTGVGKTEISRRLARLAGAPFLKIEATKFTEVGYVGRDVEQIVRDLVEVAITQTTRQKAQGREDARAASRRRPRGRRAGRPRRKPRDQGILPPQIARRRTQRQGNRDRGAIRRRRRHADDRHSRHAGRADGRDLDRRHFRQARRPARRRGGVTVAESHEILLNEESDKLLDQDQLVLESIKAVEQNGIVFLDELDKICAREGRMGGDVSREGVQRDLLAADRRHHRLDQARIGENRPYSVHRLGRVPHLQTFRLAAGIAGPAADPRRIAAR